MIPHSTRDDAVGNYKNDDLVFFEQIKKDYPDFTFRFGRKFAFHPPKTIVIGPPETHYRLLFLHELGHAIRGHFDFKTDIERLKKEVEAWEKAKELAPKYDVVWLDEVMQEELDTYRDWLHQKSRCPECGLTRFETPDGRYHCPRCELI